MVVQELFWHFFKQLSLKQWWKRCFSAQWFLKTGKLHTVTILLQALRHKDPAVRWNAIQELRKLEQSRNVTNLIDDLKKKESTSISHFSSFISGLPGHILYLSRDNPVRFFNREEWLSPYFLLENFGYSDAEEFFERFGHSLAIEALGRVGDLQVIPALLQTFNNVEGPWYSTTLKSLFQIAQRCQGDAQRGQHKKLKRVVNLLVRYRYYSEASTIVERLEASTIQNFEDPLTPLPLPKWHEDLKYAGYAFLLMVLLGITAIITIALNSAQGTIKGFVENWVQAQSISVIVALFLTLPLLATVIGITINTLKKRLEK